MTLIQGVTLNHEPFTHCIVSDLVADENFINELNKEVKSKLKFAQKNNDLYKFHQVSAKHQQKLKYYSF